jgi:hypothetical protein
MAERRKFYTSFHDLSPREYMYIPEGTLEVGRPGSFSRIELGHLVIAITVLTVAFSFTFSKNSVPFYVLGAPVDVLSYISFMPVALLGIVAPFFLAIPLGIAGILVTLSGIAAVRRAREET